MALSMMILLKANLRMTMIFVMQEARKRRGLFESEDWGKVELSYPKLASLVLSQPASDCD